MRVIINVRLAARRGGCCPRVLSFGTGVLGDRRGRPSGRPYLMCPARSPKRKSPAERPVLSPTCLARFSHLLSAPNHRIFNLASNLALEGQSRWFSVGGITMYAEEPTL